MLAACLCLLLLPGCGQGIKKDAVVEWTDPVIEQLARDYLGKPDGEIRCSDLDPVESISISSRAMAVNGVKQDGTEVSTVPWDYAFATRMYENTGVTLNCADFRCFRNLENLEVLGYGVTAIEALAGNAALSSLVLSDYEPVADDPLLKIKTLTSLGLISSDITDAGVLADLPDLTALEVSAASFETYGDNIYKLKLDLGSLAKLSHLQELTLQHGGLSSADLTPIFALTGLTRLILPGNDIDSLAGIENLTQLETLVISPDSLWLAVDVHPVASLTGLTHLALSSCSLTDLGFLAGLNSLEALSLSMNEIKDTAPLSDLAGLTYLDLYGNNVLDVAPLGALVNLTYLSLGANSVTEDGTTTTYYLINLAPLAPLVNLTEFDFMGQPFFPDCSALAGWTKLATANFSGIWVDLEHFDTIRVFSGLKKLKLNSVGNHISALKAEQLQALSALSDLEWLDLTLCNRLRDISALSGLTNLTYLNAMGCPFTSLAPLENLTKMETLQLDNADIFGLANNYTADLAPLRNLTNLRVLTLSHSGAAHSFTVQDLGPLSGMTQLRVLDLGNLVCGDLTPLAGLPSLRSLNLTDAFYETPAVLDALAANGCQITGGTAVGEKSAENEFIPPDEPPEVIIEDRK